MTGTPAHPQRVSDSSTQPALLRSRAINPRRFMEVCPYDFVRRRISSAELSGKLWHCAKQWLPARLLVA